MRHNGSVKYVGLSPRANRTLLALLALGLLGRLALAFATHGDPFDIGSFVLVRDALEHDPLHLYSLVNAPNAPHWPYPGGFLPWIAASGWLSDTLGLRFDGVIQIAPILADIALAFVVQAYLGERGASERMRIASAAVVVLAPGFWTISSYHGQIDSVPCLLAVLGVWAWQRLEARGHRALVAGALVGLAASIKQPALLSALALLPSSRSLREGAALLGAAVLVPLLSVAPFLAANFSGTVDGLTTYKGLPGFGGISLLLQPDLSAAWLYTKDVQLSALSQSLLDHGGIAAGLALLATGAYLFIRRAEPLPAAVVVWLAFFAFGINFVPTYVIYGVPFILMAGRLREAVLLEAVLVVMLALLYIPVGRSYPLEWIYTPVSLALWAGMVIGFGVAAARVSRAQPLGVY